MHVVQNFNPNMRATHEQAVAGLSLDPTGMAETAQHHVDVAPDSFDLYHQIETASEMNNAAVRLMQSDRQDDAIHLFQSSLTLLCDSQLTCFHERMIEACQWLTPVRHMTSVSAESFLEMTWDCSIVQQALTPSIQSYALDSKSVVSVSENKDLISSPQNFFSVYNRAFCFNEVRVRSLGWFRRLRLLPVVIMYNMGLAHHLIALRSVSCKTYHLAFQCYEIALNAVDEAQRTEICTSDYNLLSLALTNNMGFIRSHQFNVQQTLYFAGRMLTTFATMDCSQLLIKEEYVFYYMNLLFVLNRFPIFAPAA